MTRQYPRLHGNRRPLAHLSCAALRTRTDLLPSSVFPTPIGWGRPAPPAVDGRWSDGCSRTRTSRSPMNLGTEIVLGEDDVDGKAVEIVAGPAGMPRWS